MISRERMSKTSTCGVGSLKLVSWKFTTKKEAGDRQLPTRQSKIMFADRRVTLDNLCILIFEVSRSSIYRTYAFLQELG